MVNPKGYKPLPEDKFLAVTSELMKGEMETLDAVAARCKVSRSEVSDILKIMREKNALPAGNPFALLRPKSYQPAKKRAVEKRQAEIIKFAYARIQQGLPVSVNDLVAAKGGMKKTAKEALNYVQQRLARKHLLHRLARKTVGDQLSRPTKREVKKTRRR